MKNDVIKSLSFMLCSAICSLARPWEALLIGAIGAMLACPTSALLERLKIDDPVSCVPTHGLAGIWGLLAVGLFAEKDILERTFSNEFGLFKGGPWKFVGVQLLMSVVMAAWAGLTTLLELLLVDRLLGLRMSVEDELLGADKVEHGIDDDIPDPNHEEKEREGDNNMTIVELDLSALEKGEIGTTLSKTENGGKDSRKIIRTRRKLPRLNWRRAVSLRSSATKNSGKGTFSLKDGYSNGGVRLDVITEFAQENGNLPTSTTNSSVFHTS